jgi:hypothetical protein
LVYGRNNTSPEEKTVMTTGLSLLGFILNLVEDPVARQQFEADPEHVLRTHGFDELSAHDVCDALPLVVDTLQASVERAWASGIAGPATPPPATPLQPGETHLAAAVRHISSITTAYGTDGSVTPDKNVWVDGDVHDSFDAPIPQNAAPATGFGSGAETHLDAGGFGTGHAAAPTDDGGAGLGAAHFIEIPYGAMELPEFPDHGVAAHGVVDGDHPVDHANFDWFDGPHH